MSAPFSVADALAWTGGRLIQGDPQAVLAGVSTDTREDLAGSLFVAIRGPQHDAHAYLDQAAEAGAAALLVERADAVPAGVAIPAIEVADTTVALGALGAGHRSGFGGPLVAITGSNGKTTTKEMCAAILAVRFATHKNRGNLNNAYGLPLTLLAREAEHEALVVEIGMNHRGEIAPLAEIAAPTVGVITNVGTAHIEHLGDQDTIALEKGDLIAALSPDAVAIVNADDARVMAQAQRTRARVVSFGVAESADVRATDIRDRVGSFDFTLVTPEGTRAVNVPGLGQPTVPNALAASAAALAAGASLDDIAPGLAAFAPAAGRMGRAQTEDGTQIIDDTYNANPHSMFEALESLVRAAGSEPAVAVVGDMGELGDRAEAAHRDTGRRAAELGVGAIIALGEFSDRVIAGATAVDTFTGRTHIASDHEDAARTADAFAGPDGWILVKGSRSMRMERVVEALTRSGDQA